MLELKKECVNLELKASSKDAVLKELSHLFARAYATLENETVFSALNQREQVGTTGMGHGVAIPHAKLSSIKHEILCFGRSRLGVPFEATDNRPVFLFVGFLAPAHIAAEYLKALALITTILKQDSNREKLLHTHSPDIIRNMFNPS
jgi:PTS system nitrogen regulatory IIA component